MKKQSKRLFTLFLSLFFVLSDFQILSKAMQITDSNSDNAIYQQIANQQKTSQITASTPQISNTHMLSAKIESNIVADRTDVLVFFESEQIKDFYYKAKGLIIVSLESSKIAFQLTPQEEFSSFEITAIYNDGTSDTDTVYLYTNHNITSASNFSMDDAFFKGLQYSYEQGYITESEKSFECAEYTKQYFSYTENQLELPAQYAPQSIGTENDLSVSSADSTVIIRGYLYYRPNETTTDLLPLRHVYVELYDRFSLDIVPIDETYTDENGYYYMRCEAPDNGFASGQLGIRFSAASGSFFIAGYELQGYEYRIQKALMPGEENYGSLYLAYNENSSLFKSMYLHQMMDIGQRYAIYSGATWNGNRLRVVYPCNIFDVAGCFWGHALIPEKDFNDPDTLIHEYGHYIQQTQEFGLTLQDIESWPTHSMSEDQLFAGKPKSYAMKIAWTEAWATVFSLIAQDKYSAEYPGITFSEKSYYDYFNCESPPNIETTMQNFGEFQEWAIASFLWDLYDDGTTNGVAEAHDNVALGALNWWRYTARNGVLTLTDFINVIDQYYTSLRPQIGAILSQYRIAPSELNIKNLNNVDTMIAPTITWRVNGSVHNPNNRFQVVLFDSYNNLIWESPILESELIAYNETYTYAIPNSDWRKIVDECSGITTFNIAVRAYHSDEPISGPYMSHIITIQITSPTEASATFFTYTRYIEKCLRLDKGETFEYHITFQTAGQKIIQTFGPKDTILDLYSTDGTLLATNDDSGYSFNAFITCDVDANVQYTIRIRFFSTNVYGTTKLAIFAAKKLQADVTQSLTRYEDFFCFKNTSNHTMNGYIEKNYCVAFTFQPQVTGTYTFNINSQCDTYLYVIDPRSSDTLVIHIGYDDDSGEGLNPTLTRTLEAGVPYLVIFSAYNPSSLADTADVSIHFSSN